MTTDIATSGNSQMRLLIISQYYEPDIAASGVLMTQLCEGLAAAGVSISVVTAQPSYTKSETVAPEHETRNGVDVYRVSLGQSTGRVAMRSRMGGYIKFLFRSRRLANQLVRSQRPDIVVTASNPPLLERVGVGVAKRTNARHVHIIHDIHPDVLIAGGQIKLPPLTATVWKWLSARALRRADQLVVLSENMKRNLVDSKGVEPERVTIVNLWSVPEIHHMPEATGVRERFGIPDDHLLIIHTGNIGIIQALDQVLETATELKDSPTSFLFVGDGTMKASLQKLAANRELKNVQFLPFQSQEDFLNLLAASDACLVSLREGMERYSLPSKTFTYLAAGKPVIGFLKDRNDISTILEKNLAGWNAANVEELSTLIKDLCGERSKVAAAGVNAKMLYDREYDRSKGIAAYMELFESLLYATAP